MRATMREPILNRFGIHADPISATSSDKQVDLFGSGSDGRGPLDSGEPRKRPARRASLTLAASSWLYEEPLFTRPNDPFLPSTATKFQNLWHMKRYRNILSEARKFGVACISESVS